MATYSQVCSAVGSFGYASRFTLYVVLTNRNGDPATNKSVVDYNVYFENTSGGGTFTSNTRLYFALNGGVIKDSTSSITGPRNGQVSIASGSITVDHNNDGTKAIGFHALVQGVSFGIKGEISGTFTLNTIPRASTVKGGSGNIGEQSTISISRASTSFTHTLRYSFGNLRGTIATGVGDSYTWTIPTSFYSQIPNASYGVGGIDCDTYSGSTLIGTTSVQLTANVNKETSRPTVTGTVVDTNATTIALTGNANKLIKYKSTAKATISASAKNSASISKKVINGTTVSGNELSIANVSATSFKFETVDSRGYPNSTTVTPQMIDYVPLTINANFFRPQPTTGEVKLKYSGNYFDGNFGAKQNSVGIEWHYRVKGSSTWIKGGNITPTISENKIVEQTISLGTNFDYQTAYEFYIYAQDQLTSFSATIPVSVGMPVFYWGKDFFNIIGQIRETLKLDTNTGIYWKEKNYGDQFQIIPDFNGYDDNNKLKIMGAVGGTGTQPELVDLMTISGRNGYVTANGYYDKGSMLTLPAGNDDYTYWNSLQNGWYWHDNNYPVANLPSDWGFVEKRGFVGADFTITYYKQSSGTIYRKSGNAWSCSGWEIISNPAVILYDNASGTTGTITLSETVANFSYIEIFYNCENRASIKVDNPNGKTIMLTITQWVDKKRTFMSKATLSGTSLTRSENYFADSDGYRQEYTGIYITKVVGYR